MFGLSQKLSIARSLQALVRAGIAAGYLTLDAHGGVGLTERGGAWYRHDADR
jgi:hypothetical protein